jgi:dTDP-4-dehydrorhamnose 3,5-epimerase
MKFVPLGIAGARLVQLEPHADERGFFARSFCEDEFTDAGLPAQYVQSSLSFNARRGTVRGLHFQRPPSREDKLVRCIRGALHDVLLDLRPASATYLRHVAVRLDDRNRDAAFIPHGVAHGFLTLADETEVLYQMTDVYAPELAAGVRWDDPVFGIDWPKVGDITISERDAHYPSFDRQAFEAHLAGLAGPGA